MKVFREEYLAIQEKAENDSYNCNEISNFSKYGIARTRALDIYKSNENLKRNIYIVNFFIPLDNDFIIIDQLYDGNYEAIAKYYGLRDLYETEVYRRIVINLIENKRKQLRRFYQSYKEISQEINEGGIKNNVYVYKNGKRRKN
jgi:hypothetical protein